MITLILQGRLNKKYFHIPLPLFFLVSRSIKKIADVVAKKIR